MDFQKDRARAVRRHHVVRLKAKRLTYWGRHSFEWTARALGMVVATPCLCSCYVCGNARKYLGERSMQERRFTQVERLTGLDASCFDETGE